MAAEQQSTVDASGPLVHPDLVAAFEALLGELGYSVAQQVVAAVCFRIRAHSREPTLSFRDFHRLATTFGLDAEAVWVELDELEEADLPCVAHCRDGRFIALLHAAADGMAVFDPAVGPTTMNLASLEGQWGGAILSVRHGNPKETQRRLDAVARHPQRVRQEALLEQRGATRVATTCMSDVYRADGGTRCLKMVPFYVPEESFILTSFRRELELLLSLGAGGHPNVSSVLEEVDGERCYATEWFNGVPIGALREPLPADRALNIVRQIVDGLQFIHRNGIVHRDLSPLNVLVDDDDRALIIDFGLAFRVDDGQPGLPRAGTYAFRAPEQWRGDSIGPATDVFCLGLLAYYLLTNEHPLGDHTGRDWGADPYDDDNVVHMYSRIAQLDVRLAPLVAACLAVDAEDRCSLAEAAMLCAELVADTAQRLVG